MECFNKIVIEAISNGFVVTIETEESTTSKLFLSKRQTIGYVSSGIDDIRRILKTDDNNEISL